MGKPDFPLDREGLDFIQKMIQSVYRLAHLGGFSYILLGCEKVDDNTVNPGMLVIDGELIEFAGGAIKEKISIKESKENLTAGGVNYPEAYTYRKAEFSDVGELEWDSLKQILSNKELQEKIEELKGDAPGTVKMWSGQIAKIPSDYRICDGTLLSVHDYPELFKNLGTSFGGDGVNEFVLPDIRGRFVVGYDTSKSDYRTISKDNVGGAEDVALTVDQIPTHDHVNHNSFNKLSAKAGDINDQATPGSIDQANAAQEYNVGSMSEDRWIQATIQKVGGGKSHENRPPYFVLAYIIKVK